MTEINQQANPTHKLIIINDLNRELTPIGYGFQSPIYRPSRFSVETIGQLLNISKVTAMYEIYEKDHTLQVHLNKNNYRKPFEEIWKEQNPGKEFPWARSVKTVESKKDSQPETPQAPSESSNPEVEQDSENENSNVNGNVSSTISLTDSIEIMGNADTNQETAPENENTDVTEQTSEENQNEESDVSDNEVETEENQENEDNTNNKENGDSEKSEPTGQTEEQSKAQSKSTDKANKKIQQQNRKRK